MQKTKKRNTNKGMNIDCTMYREIIANVKAVDKRTRMNRNGGALPVNFAKQSGRDVRDFC